MVCVHLKHHKPVFHLPRVHIFLCYTSLSRLGRITKKNHFSGELDLSIHPSSKVTNWRALWIWHSCLRFRYKHLACAFSKMRRVCCVCAWLSLMTVLWAWFKKKKDAPAASLKFVGGHMCLIQGIVKYSSVNESAGFALRLQLSGRWNVKNTQTLSGFVKRQNRLMYTCRSEGRTAAAPVA